MNIVLVPRDGLAIKDARGFNVAGGAAARGIDWPLPATTAGAVRAAIGRARGYTPVTPGHDEHRAAWLALQGSVTVTGPLAVTRASSQTRWKRLWPCPADAVAEYHRRKGRRVHCLAPTRAIAAWTGTPADAITRALLWPEAPFEGKPAHLPAWWHADTFEEWLRDPPSDGPRDFDYVTEVGAEGAARRFDAHVRIDPDTLTAEDGMLFGHDVYEHLVASRKDYVELGVALKTEAEGDGLAPLGGVAWTRLGGRGRVAAVETIPDEVFAFPRLWNRWTPSPRLRLVLVTPACFERGWHPDWLAPQGDHLEGVIPGTDFNVRLCAAIVPRARTHSGWDLVARAPRASQRLVSAGAVYYVERLGGAFDLDGLRTLWLRSLQIIDSQEARDGYGLCVPGAWP